MKNSNAVEFLTPAAGSRSFRSLSAAELVGLLCSLYLAFCFDQRRARFGAAVSDESIARYCRELAQREVLVVGCLAPDGLVAVAELHPCRDSIELALAGRDTQDRDLRPFAPACCVRSETARLPEACHEHGDSRAGAIRSAPRHWAPVYPR